VAFLGGEVGARGSAGKSSSYKFVIQNQGKNSDFCDRLAKMGLKTLEIPEVYRVRV